MSDINYKQFYNKVGRRIGWDFSKLKEIEEGKEWDFIEEVSKKAKPVDTLLDIGTGGGEQVLKIADKVKSIIGIDNSGSMLHAADKNLEKSGYKNVKFIQMDAFKLKFPDNSFDLVTSRHCDFSPKEAYRVLRKGGHFMTQQVSEGDKINIKKTFGRGQAYGVKDGILKDRYLKELKKVGFKNIKADEYNSINYYKTPEDLVFLLKNTPIIHDFGKNKKDFEILEKFIEEYKTPKGIKTNSKRFKITAKKMNVNNKINVRVRLVIIHNRKVLVQYRQEGDFYHYIGGHLEYGETIETACIREAKEECGGNVEFNFEKILYIRDFIKPDENEHSVELFILGSINKTDKLEGLKDPQHPDGLVWMTWLDIDNLPSNLLPKTLSPKLLNDFNDGFPKEGEYIGEIV